MLLSRSAYAGEESPKALMLDTWHQCTKPTDATLPYIHRAHSRPHAGTPLNSVMLLHSPRLEGDGLGLLQTPLYFCKWQ